MRSSENPVPGIVRHYTMKAKPDRYEDLKAALSDLAEEVIKLVGCERVELLHDPQEPLELVFLEYWSSSNAYNGSKGLVSKASLDSVMGVIDEAPRIRSFEKIDI